MAGEMKYEIRQQAYIKLVLHALKHPSAAVNGILVGRLSSAGGGGDGSTHVLVEDAVPLSHSLLPLLPTLEIALLQVDEYFRAEGLEVVGYYQANERYDDGELGGVAKKIGDHIVQHFPQAALLLLDNKKVEALHKGGSGGPAVQLFTKDSSKTWRQADVGTQLIFKEPSANVVLLDYIATKKWQQIVDFDDHLDDISKDWLNSDLFK